MKKETTITITVIGGLVLLGIGFSLGLVLGKKAMEGVKTEASLADLLESKAMESLDIMASGEVVEIAGRNLNLTLNKEGDTLTILIKEDAPIYRLVSPEETIAEAPQPVIREEIEFGEIKAGDRTNISCELKADGSLWGKTVIILP